MIACDRDEAAESDDDEMPRHPPAHNWLNPKPQINLMCHRQTPNQMRQPNHQMMMMTCHDLSHTWLNLNLQINLMCHCQTHNQMWQPDQMIMMIT